MPTREVCNALMCNYLLAINMRVLLENKCFGTCFLCKAGCNFAEQENTKNQIKFSMKKILSILVCFVISVSFASVGNTAAAAPDSKNPPIQKGDNSGSQTRGGDEATPPVPVIGPGQGTVVVPSSMVRLSFIRVTSIDDSFEGQLIINGRMIEIDFPNSLFITSITLTNLLTGTTFTSNHGGYMSSVFMMLTLFDGPWDICINSKGVEYHAQIQVVGSGKRRF